jgi:hypothetical protein
MLWCLLLLGKLWYGGASKNQSKSATENEMNPKHDARDNAEETKCWGLCAWGTHAENDLVHYQQNPHHDHEENTHELDSQMALLLVPCKSRHPCRIMCACCFINLHVISGKMHEAGG